MRKTCPICGEQFETGRYGGRRQCCSDACSHERILRRMRSYDKRYHKRKYVKRAPKEHTCPLCGRTFYGHGNAKYCIECLETSQSYKFQQYYWNRKERAVS